MSKVNYSTKHLSKGSEPLSDRGECSQYLQYKEIQDRFAAHTNQTNIGTNLIVIETQGGKEQSEKIKDVREIYVGEAGQASVFVI